MRRLSPLLAFTLLFSGCTWIDDAQREARKGQVDDDGDGVIASKDCDDEDPTRSTAEPEIWYDGIDEDCGGDDDYDQDDDGYVPSEFVGLTTLQVKGSGTLPGGDCDDQEPMASPQQPDAWYDGVDSKCDGGDDFDQDGDGFVADENVGLTTTYVGTSGMLPGGDCNDGNSAVNPDAPDTAYDGLDSDCAGNNDYDADGDGFVADEWFEEAGGLPSGDCDDEDAAIYKDAPEVWYSGYDDACDGGDDFDQDGDGYVRTADIGRETCRRAPQGDETECPLVEGTGDLPGGDCNDEAPATHPFAHEVYGDSFDEDCDGGIDSIEVHSIDGYAWQNPFTPVLLEAEGRVFLSVAVEQVVTPTDNWFDSGFALSWAVGNIENAESEIEEFAWAKNATNPSFAVGPAHTMRVFGDTVYGVLGREGTNFRSLAMEAYPLGSGAAGQATAQSSVAKNAFEDVDVYVDDAERVFGIGCDGGTDTPTFTYARVDQIASSTSADVHTNVTDGSANGSACAFAEDTEPYVLAAYAGDLYEFTFDPDSSAPTFTGTSTSLGRSPVDIDTSLDGTSPIEVLALPGLHAVYVEGTGISAYVGQASDTPQSAAAIRLTDGDYLIGWVNDDGSVRLAKGSDGSGYAYVSVNTDEVATDIALWADDTNAMVAVSSAAALSIGIYDW